MRLATLFLAAVAGFGAPITVQFDTKPLPAGAYYLDFQLIGSDSLAGNNTVLISGLDLGGGMPLSVDLIGATGSFPNYSMKDASFFNEALIGFTRTGQVRFGLTFNNAYSQPGTPDTFTVAVLDSGFNSIVSTGLGASLVVSLGGGAAPDVRTYRADPAFGSILPAVTANVPEPSTSSLIGLSIVTLKLWRARRAAP